MVVEAVVEALAAMGGSLTIALTIRIALAHNLHTWTHFNNIQWSGWESPIHRSRSRTQHEAWGAGGGEHPGAALGWRNPTNRLKIGKTISCEMHFTW